MARLRHLIFVVLAAAFTAQSALAAQLPTGGYRQWLQDMEAEAIDQGINPDIVHAALDKVMPNEHVIALDQKQPETLVSFAAYADRIVSPLRVRDGKRMRTQYAEPLDTIADHYGVPAGVIIALWGIESIYGANSGDFSTIDALATLAYEGRRADFFRQELIDALRILDEEHMAARDLRGSWAGAIGQCQFMPSIYLRYAVDYNGSGKRDVWNDKADVLASIANYLSAEGWKRDDGWGQEVTLTADMAPEDIGLDKQLTLGDWEQKGIRQLDGSSLPEKPLTASLVQPDGPHGRSFLVYDNFRALMRWNRSTYFALAVGLLSDRIE